MRTFVNNSQGPGKFWNVRSMRDHDGNVRLWTAPGGMRPLVRVGSVFAVQYHVPGAAFGVTPD